MAVISACGSSPATPSPPPGAQSAWESVLDEVGPDGSVSTETALKAFALAFGDVPGVQLPPGPRGPIRSGTFALRMLVAHWADITDEQRRAAIRNVPDLATMGLTPAVSGYVQGALVPISRDPGGSRILYAQKRTNEVYTQLAQGLFGEIGSLLKTPLNVGFTIIAKVGLTEQTTSGMDTSVLNASGGKDGTMTQCVIVVSHTADAYDDENLKGAMAHEMWHCFEGAVVGLARYWSDNPAPWITEGEADYVGFTFAPTTGAGYPESWPKYLKKPELKLFERAYDGVGFYSQLGDAGIDPWEILVPVLKAATNEDAYVAGHGDRSEFLDLWASGYLRDESRKDGWEIVGPGITTDRAKPGGLQLSNGGQIPIEVAAYTNEIDVFGSKPDILTVTLTGHGRISDAAGHSYVLVGGGTFCLVSGGCGQCAGLQLDGPQVALGVTGGQTGNTGQLIGSSIQGCKPKQKPCSAGCGGSNGDPHMRTIDGSRYELQAAGEYVLLRSPDASIEVQARQEPEGANVSINTAAAVRVNGHRVGFYVSDEGIPAVRVDGNAVDAGAVTTADLGAGAKLTGYQRGYELDLPDGTKVWALSVGHWGINLLVLPSSELRRTGVGLLAGVPASARYRVPALPDGTTIGPPTDRQDEYHLLYEVLAPAWRVTDATSLFDYDEGKSTESFTVAPFPPPEAPRSMSEVDPTDLATARQMCAGVTDVDLADQCAFDVAVTGENDFATLYIVSDGLESEGTSSLDQAPPTTAPAVTPIPTGGPPPAGINFVLDHVAGVSARLLAPNGKLYADVATQAVAFGDVKYTVLEIDPQTGQILEHADAATGGMLAWADGSIWAGEFARAEIGVCQISRLDPDSLAVQASVPTICGDQYSTILAAIGDAVWFVDPTGATPEFTGGHLRRIDPATNTIDPVPASNLELPLLPQFVVMEGSPTTFVSTSAGLIYGSRHDGLYLLRVGSATFDKLVLPAFGLLFPSADGFWTVTDTGGSDGQGSLASFFNGGEQPSMTVGFDGYLAGADDGAIYVEVQDDVIGFDTLVRYPIDGSAPAEVAVGGNVPNSFGTETSLAYGDSLISPLLYGEHLLVKTWTVPMATQDTGAQLLVQPIPIP